MVDLREPMADPAIQRRLAFLAPGFLHGLGNALFAIQGQAQVLAAQLRQTVEAVDGAAATARTEEILSASSNANTSLDIFRTLSQPQAEAEPVSASGALRTVLDQVRIALRESGLAVEFEDDGAESSDLRDDPVPKHAFLAATVDTIMAIRDAVPTGYRGHIRFHRDAPTSLRIELVDSRGQLPFDIDFAAAFEAASSALADTGLAVDRSAERQLHVTLPRTASIRSHADE